MIEPSVLEQAIKAVQEAQDHSIAALKDGRIETEPTFTDRLIGSLESKLDDNGLAAGGYLLTARTLRDRGSHAPEREFGADLAVVFSVLTARFVWSKGFLAQAKMASNDGLGVPGRGTTPDGLLIRRSLGDDVDPGSLFSQCKEMLTVTPASFVFIYSPSGVFVIPASAITATVPNSGLERAQTRTKPLTEFMKEFFSSFIGDWHMRAFDNAQLRALSDRYPARSFLLFSLVGIADTTRPRGGLTGSP